jgi:inhibitor of cysteine peptidase
MKKYLGLGALVLVTVLAFGVLAGCGSSKTTPTTPKSTPTQTKTIKVYTESTKNITAKVGESFIISLKSNPTTGYQWQITGPLSPAVVKVSQSFVAGKTTGTATVGVGGVENFTFKAASKGQALIQMEYLQAGSGTNGGSANFNVTVN